MMAVPQTLHELIGNWQGTKHLWLTPNEPVRKSAATAVIQPAAQGKFLLLQYSWSEANKPQDGVLLLGQDEEQLTAAWVDSWHMQDKMMLCADPFRADGEFSVLGHYAAPPGPDWGWRITVQPQPSDQFTFRMYNITPAGESVLAVEILFARIQ